MPRRESVSTDVLFRVGIASGGGARFTLTNTCPMDSVLAILHSVVSFGNRDFLVHLGVNSTDQEGALSTVLEKLQSGHVDHAKDAWVDYLISQNILQRASMVSMWGCVMRLFSEEFEHVYRQTVVTICTNGNYCPSYRVEQRPHKLAVVEFPQNFDNSGTLSLLCSSVWDCAVTVKEESFSSRALFLAHSRLSDVFSADSDCEDTSEYVCSGKRVVDSRKVPKHCWMIPLDVSGVPKSQIFNLPGELLVNGSQVFNLRGVVFFKPGHFYSYILSFDKWYFYCGDDAPYAVRVEDVWCTGNPKIALYTL